MGFNKKTTLNGNPVLIPAIAERIASTLQADGYEVSVQGLYNDGVDISITKGGFFKAILGMKTALKVTLLPMGNLINFEATVGIFGQQAVPTIIMLFVAWPVIITQIWGLIQQSALDDNVLAIANQVIMENMTGEACPPPPPYQPEAVVTETIFTETIATDPGVRFCSECGAKLPANAKFCSSCGTKL